LSEAFRHVTRSGTCL